ncbi:MAG: hypothetical protein JWQ09_4627, partial [Segetibacter sp.]|nr:hypothetical protein [Segetibacter sp.]
DIVVSLTFTATKNSAGSFSLVPKAPFRGWGFSCVAHLSPLVGQQKISNVYLVIKGDFPKGCLGKGNAI